MTKRPTRQQTRKQCEIATAFVNNRRLDRFVRTHKNNLRPLDTQFLEQVGIFLRQAWDPSKRVAAEENLEQILADRKKAILDEWKHGEFRPLPLSPFERSAFRVRLGEDRPVFEPRDVLDEIAYTILRASKNRLLKTCQGKLSGWDCKTPYLVADEGRRRYCFESCGDQAKAEAKKKNPRT